MKKFNISFLNIKYINKKLIVYFILVSILYGLYGTSFILNNSSEVNFNFGDVFLFLFGGVQYRKDSLIDYTSWFGFILLIYYPIIYFLSKQFADKKVFIFYRIKKYKYWYYSNIFIAFLKVILFFIFMYAATFIIALKPLGYSGVVSKNIFNNLKYSVSTNTLIVQLISINILFIIAVILLAMNLFFVTKKFNISVLIVLILTYLSSFINLKSSAKYSLGNVAMLVQNVSFSNGNSNITFNYSIGFFLVIIISNLILGNFLYKRSIEI